MAFIHPKDMKVLVWIEQYHLRVGEFPNRELLSRQFPDFDLEANLKNEVFLNALKNRGIKLPSSDDNLSNEQVAAIAAVANFVADGRSLRAKLKDLGISPTKWQGWMRQKEFKTFLHDLTGNNFKDSLHVAQEGLLRSVERGNTDAIKFYLEATGQYQSPETQNIKIILSRIMEAITINVKDPDVVRAIAADFERIMTGQPPVERKELAI